MARVGIHASLSGDIRKDVLVPGGVDKHEQIGRGSIGMEGFRRIINHPGLSHLLFILEAPIAGPVDDRSDLQILRSFMSP
jgi:endonuclease IV